MLSNSTIQLFFFFWSSRMSARKDRDQNCGSIPLSTAPLATIEETEPSEESITNTQCGYQIWHPECLQAFNKPPVLVACIASYSFCLGMYKNMCKQMIVILLNE